MVIKYKNDDRYSKYHIVTHSQYKVDTISCKMLWELNDIINNYDVILIDEIQFYKDASYICDQWANIKIVECYGLNGDYKREPFQQISLLISLADNITHLTAIDKFNGKDSPFTHRINRWTRYICCFK